MNMVRGYLARRIYTSPVSWRRNAILSVNGKDGTFSIVDFDGVEPPATTFVDGVILPFEPVVTDRVPLERLLLSQFPVGEFTPSHYWLLDFPGIFSGAMVPTDSGLVKIVRLC